MKVDYLYFIQDEQVQQESLFSNMTINLSIGKKHEINMISISFTIYN